MAAGAVTLEEWLASARSGLTRFAPADALRAVASGAATLVDIRSDTERERDGIVPGSVCVPRNVLEWRCAPSSRWREPSLSDPAGTLIVMCDEGYQSSVAAAALQQLGLAAATDIVGGFQAWRRERLPVEPANG